MRLELVRNFGKIAIDTPDAWVGWIGQQESDGRPAGVGGGRSDGDVHCGEGDGAEPE